MKNFKVLLILFTLSATILTNYGCNKDEATCTDGIQNGDETGIDCGGSSCTACPTCDDGVQNGDETGIDCGGSCSTCLVGAQGTKWQSSGTNVATLLAGDPFNVDSIYVEFDELTYHVEQFSGGVQTILEGSYSQTASGVGEIWNIILIQSVPSALTAEGIFEISADGNTLTYEVLQTEPDLGFTAPTAAAGFGSTNGGTFADWNIQVYEKVD